MTEHTDQEDSKIHTEDDPGSDTLSLKKDRSGRNSSISGKLFKFLLKTIPLIIVLVIISLIVIPLGKKITAKKQELKEQQSREKAAVYIPPNVVTLALVPGLITEKLSYPGLVRPWVSLDVVAEIQGRVTAKQIQEGDTVSKGDIVAVIDKSDYENAYNSALASYESALSTQKRLKALVKNDFVTKSNLDDADAHVKMTKAALDNAALALSRCSITSPMEGIVNRVFIETGKFLSPGDPVVQILQIDQIKIQVGIPESDVEAVRKLKQFSITIDALGRAQYTGEYHYLYKTSDTLARLFNLDIRVDNPDHSILPDMFARVEIIKNQDTEGLAVPVYAILEKNGRSGVFVEDKGIVQFREVVKGFQSGWKTQIAQGLEPGEKVVVSGHRIIDDGQKVNVVRQIPGADWNAAGSIEDLTR